MRDAVIVAAVRTPTGKGKPGGALSGVHPVELFAHSLRMLVERTGIDPALVDDVIGGSVDQVGEQAMNTTRYALLAAGFPESVPGTTVDRQCGSSQQALSFAAQGLIAGAYDVVIAGGIESMSRVPMWSNVPAGKDPFGPSVAARYPAGLVPQGISAELIAAKWGIGREAMDSFAARSHQLAAAATAEGRFAAQLAPVKAPDPTGALVDVASDQTIRGTTTVEALAGLPPSFVDPGIAARYPQLDWSVTAGNSSPLSDGSSAVLLMTSEKAAQLGLTPLARVHTTTVVGDDPIYMLTGIIPATAKVLARAGLRLDDIDLFEVNEAFASVVLAWQAETGVPLEKVNVNGGAIAIGHPLGASGTRIATTLVHALHERGARYGLQLMCEAGGLANATVYERLG
jgi:acetyl-CoA acyltransferase